MLSNRIVASLIVKDDTVVQSLGFSHYLPVGSPQVAVEFLNQWGIDEIIVLDIGSARTRRVPDRRLVSALSKKGFVPLTIGGGIDDLETVRQLIHGGADKVSINRAAVLNAQLISAAAGAYGNQCVVVSIDAKHMGDGRYEVFIDSGQVATGKDPAAHAAVCESLGAGEILIRSIDRDGSKQGFDLRLIQRVREAVTIPVIAAGGCGRPQHIREAFEQGGADAVAVGNLFHFTEHSVTTAKAYLQEFLPIRLDSDATYAHARLNAAGRLEKQPDDALEKLRFEYHPKEVI